MSERPLIYVFRLARNHLALGLRRLGYVISQTMPYRGHFWNLIPALDFLVRLDLQRIPWKFERPKTFTLDLGALTFVLGIKVPCIALCSGARNRHLIMQSADMFVFIMPTKTHSSTSVAFFIFETYLSSDISYFLLGLPHTFTFSSVTMRYDIYAFY